MGKRDELMDVLVLSLLMLEPCVNGARLFLGTAFAEASQRRQRRLPVWVYAPHTPTHTHTHAHTETHLSRVAQAWLRRCCGGPFWLRLRQPVFEQQGPGLRSVPARWVISLSREAWSPEDP